MRRVSDEQCRSGENNRFGSLEKLPQNGHGIQYSAQRFGDFLRCLAARNDGNGGQGATIFHAKTFAKALPLYSHQ